jgi:hypothetical protein
MIASEHIAATPMTSSWPRTVMHQEGGKVEYTADVMKSFRAVRAGSESASEAPTIFHPDCQPYIHNHARNALDMSELPFAHL